MQHAGTDIYAILEPGRIQMLFDKRRYTVLVLTARDGVYDE